MIAYKIATFCKKFHVVRPLFLSRVRAGFPSPADDHIDKSLDLNELLIDRPAATFFCRVTGDSMSGLGIMDGSILVVDRSQDYKHGDIVLAAVDGELTCKVLDEHNSRLLSSNERYPPIQITEGMEVIIEGVVTSWITQSDVRAS